MSGLGRYRRLGQWAFPALVCLLVFVAFAIRPSLPSPIRISTAKADGQYHAFGMSVVNFLRTKDIGTTAVISQGSVMNRDRLRADPPEADCAIIQQGAVPMAGLAVVTPLYHDVIHIVVRRAILEKHKSVKCFGDLVREIETTNDDDLKWDRFTIGTPRSGMIKSAEMLLEFHGVATKTANLQTVYFRTLLSSPSLTGAIVTTGLLNGDLSRVMESGEFALLPILDADALAVRHAYLTSSTIPKGVFPGKPRTPDVDIPTVATTALLVVRDDPDNDLLVSKLLEAVYLSNLRGAFPTLFSREEAARFDGAPMHRTSRSFFAPYQGLNELANVMETLGAAKELLFALGAGLYLLWRLRERRRKKRAERETREQKEMLDALLEKTVAIERRQMNEADPERLEDYLDQVTAIKLEALEELTGEELRGDRMFLIFLTQCANLVRKIQSKLLLCSSTSRAGSSADSHGNASAGSDRGER